MDWLGLILLKMVLPLAQAELSIDRQQLTLHTEKVSVEAASLFPHGPEFSVKTAEQRSDVGS